jgi:hypothetical protein
MFVWSSALGGSSSIMMYFSQREPPVWIGLTLTESCEHLPPHLLNWLRATKLETRRPEGVEGTWP